MSKELILKLRYIALCADRADVRETVGQAADALEAKAAPVGEIQRYDLADGYCGSPACMEPSENGYYVKFEDHVASQRQQEREVVGIGSIYSAFAAWIDARTDEAKALAHSKLIDALDQYFHADQYPSPDEEDEFARLNKGACSHE